jgi:tRNA threonylcarbamoyladenosine biosynthesis protein TsaE
MNQIRLLVRSLDDTERLGAALADSLPDGTTVALCGTLGAGKTRLVQAVAANCGVPRVDVVSPTFVLCQEYHGTRLIYHLDAYRLRDDDEFQQMGPEELFRSPALIFIEWADRIRQALPEERLEIQIHLDDHDVRTFVISACGDRYIPVLNAIRTHVGARNGG